MRIGNAGIFIFLVSLSRSADFPEFLTGNENLFGQHAQPLQISRDDGLLQAVLLFQPLHMTV